VWCPTHLSCGVGPDMGKWWSPALPSWPNSGIRVVVRWRVQGWPWAKVLD